MIRFIDSSPSEHMTSKGWVRGTTSQTLLERVHVEFVNAHASGVFRELSARKLMTYFPEIFGIVDDVQSLAHDAGYQDVKLSKVWFQRSTAAFTDDNKNQVPFVPHIDGTRYVKAMIYVGDIPLDSGPMHISSVSPEDLEPLRRRFGPDYKELGENIVDVPMAELTALEGPAGTVIVFDTNTPHSAAPIKADRERWLIRMDFSSNGWPSPVQGGAISRLIGREAR